MEETIELQELFKIIKKRSKLILAVTMITIALAAFVSFVILTPIYEASTQILVNQKQEENAVVNAQDIQTNIQLINTYNVIITSPAILDIVAERLNDEYTVEGLKSKITVDSVQNSQVIRSEESRLG